MPPHPEAIPKSNSTAKQCPSPPTTTHEKQPPARTNQPPAKALSDQAKSSVQEMKHEQKTPSTATASEAERLKRKRRKDRQKKKKELVRKQNRDTSKSVSAVLKTLSQSSSSVASPSQLS